MLISRNLKKLSLILLCFVLLFGRTQAQDTKQNQMSQNKSHSEKEQEILQKNTLHAVIKAYKQSPTSENARKLLAQMPTTREGWNKFGEPEDPSLDDIGDFCYFSTQIIPDYPKYVSRFLMFATLVTGEYGEYVSGGVDSLFNKRMGLVLEALKEFSERDRNAVLGLLQLEYAGELRILTVRVEQLTTKNAKMIALEMAGLLREKIESEHPSGFVCKTKSLTLRQKTFLKYVQLGEFNKVKSMLSIMKSVNFQDDLGFTPLMYCVVTGDKRIAELLLNKGANVTIKNCFGDTVKDIVLGYNRNWLEIPGDIRLNWGVEKKDQGQK